LDRGKKINLIDELSKLSPIEKIYEELEKEKLIENMVGFIPCGNSTDTSAHIVNLAVYIASKGKNVLIVDANVFYPSIYKLMDIELPERGKGILRILKDDRMDIREEIQKTSLENIFLISASPLDPMEEYFDLEEQEVERFFSSVKEVFDIVLVEIPNIPPLEFFYAGIKSLSVGFLMWSQRLECPVNTKRMMYFLNSIGVSTSKIGNVVFCNTEAMGFDMGVVKNMGLRFVADLPMVPQVYSMALEGKIYMKDCVFMDKRYKSAIEIVGNIVIR
jgi:hypothetical protein